MRWIVFLLFAMSAAGWRSLAAQDLYKELSKLDPNSVTAIVDGFGKKHADQLVNDHTAQLAELEKSGVQIIRGDILLAVDKPTKIAFAWPVAGGQKASDKSVIKRDPYVMTLYPTRDATGKETAQKWQVTYAAGTVKAVE